MNWKISEKELQADTKESFEDPEKLFSNLEQTRKPPVVVDIRIKHEWEGHGCFLEPAFWEKGARGSPATEVLTPVVTIWWTVLNGAFQKSKRKPFFAPGKK